MDKDYWDKQLKSAISNYDFDLMKVNQQFINS